MLITIVVIASFQVYWLRKSFMEEKHLFTVRTNLLFRETTMRLQASKLHLDSNISIRINDKEGIIGMTNILQERFRDSSPPGTSKHRTMVVTIDQQGNAPFIDSAIRYPLQRHSLPGAGGPVADFLTVVDSLHDSISVKELTDRYRIALAKQQIRLPFVITKKDSATLDAATTEAADDNTVTIGFMRPHSYQFNFTNSHWYLLQKLWQPILISLLLVGVTIASFLLLYRNLVQQQKLTQLKNDFISNITHELKTPIATVSVAIEALNNFNALQDPQRTKEYLDISASEMQRLGLLVDKVLKLSLYENNKIALKKESVDMAALAREVLASMRLQLEKHAAEVSVTTHGANFTIEADRLHMASVIYNLLDNALKYSKGKPVIELQLKEHAQFIEMLVADNGIGIASEYRYKVFEQFFRVPGGDRHNIKGYGLGLSYVNHIVQSHHGFIEVKSKLDEGSTFIVRLPFKEAAVIDYGDGRKVRRIQFKINKA